MFSQALAARPDGGGLELSETLTVKTFFKNTVFTSNDTVVFLQGKFKTKEVSNIDEFSLPLTI